MNDPNQELKTAMLGHVRKTLAGAGRLKVEDLSTPSQRLYRVCPLKASDRTWEVVADSYEYLAQLVFERVARAGGIRK